MSHLTLFRSIHKPSRRIIWMPFLSILFSLTAYAQLESEWVKLDKKFFSFSHPKGWDVEEGSDRDYVIRSPDGKFILNVEFREGFRNEPTLAVQCAGLDQLLRDEVAAYIKNNSPVSQTFEGPHPGRLGGRHMRVSSGKEGINLNVEGVLRDNGVYLIAVIYPVTYGAIDQLISKFGKSVTYSGGQKTVKDFCWTK